MLWCFSSFDLYRKANVKIYWKKSQIVGNHFNSSSDLLKYKDANKIRSNEYSSAQTLLTLSLGGKIKFQIIALNASQPIPKCISCTLGEHSLSGGQSLHSTPPTQDFDRANAISGSFLFRQNCLQCILQCIPTIPRRNGGTWKDFIASHAGL